MFIGRQIREIQDGGLGVVLEKIRKSIYIASLIPSVLLALPFVILIRLTSSLFLIRIGKLRSSRIGHFAANTELYLCEKMFGFNTPNIPYLDIFYLSEKPICNKQLAKMWSRVIFIGPTWIMSSIDLVNRIIPGGQKHFIGCNTNHDRDVHNLYDKSLPHLKFTDEEKKYGQSMLRKMKIPPDGKFVCLIVRDSAYLDSHLSGDWSYHNYRDSEIKNYELAISQLTMRGYYVVRMGVKVNEPMGIKNNMVIDYAINGMRNDFMDIYLGANCEFCVSTGAGWDAVPQIFRRPIVYVNFVPVGYVCSYRKQALTIFKHHVSAKENKSLTLTEIFKNGVGFSMLASDYDSKSIKLIDNSPEEILDVVMEMANKVEGLKKLFPEDNVLQTKFWSLFSRLTSECGLKKPAHGEFRSKCGASFLRESSKWVQ
jgi:putative glycosyltransferase (TIGR04372 family)